MAWSNDGVRCSSRIKLAADIREVLKAERKTANQLVYG
jgi:hypothetical protein